MQSIALLALTGAIGYSEVQALRASAQTHNRAEVVVQDPLIVQTQVEHTCNGPLKRLLREGYSTVDWAGEKFNDVSFPPTTESLSWTTDYSTWTWFSPTRVETTPSLWGTDGVRPAAIKQGSLGDCWLLASIAAIAENGDRIKKIFNGLTAWPSTGEFELNLWAYGNPVRVTIDDKIPATINSTGTALSPRFTKKSANGSWWVPILEKAAGKYYGFYWNMNGGWMSEALYIFTGMPNTEFNSASLTTDQIFARLTEWDQKNYIMTGAVNCETGIDKFNLVCGHAYTVLGTKVAPNGQKLVQLRNPWGTEQYTGPWNDNDTVNMTPEVKAALGYTSANDGIFFMRIEDFKPFVNSVVTALYQDWKTSVVQEKWNRVESIMTRKWSITNPVQQDVSLGFIGAYQRDMQDSACAAPEKVDNLAFSLKNSANAYVTDQYGQQYSWLTAWNGNGWLNFKALPAGTYTVVMRAGSTATTGDMPFTVESFAASQVAPVVRIA